MPIVDKNHFIKYRSGVKANLHPNLPPHLREGIIIGLHGTSKKFDPWAFQIILLKQVISSRIATLLVGIRSISEVNLGVSGLLEKGLALFILELNGP